jgi:ERI1 exoribonuclease 2
METECQWRGIDKPGYFNSWVDLKVLFQKRYRRTSNLHSCCESVGLKWQGRAHSGIDDALNTARLAVHMIRDGCVLAVSGSFAPPAAAPGGSRQPARQAPLEPLEPAKPAKLFDGQGRWGGRCRCGVQAKQRVTRRPGANHGRAFFGCGRWSITQKGGCGFMMWADEVKGGGGACGGLAR